MPAPRNGRNASCPWELRRESLHSAALMSGSQNSTKVRGESCGSCQGTGEMPTDFGIAECPDCGGVGQLPPRAVQTEWRARDIGAAALAGRHIEPADVKWLLAEFDGMRSALTEILALAQESEAEECLARIRFTANRALGLYPVKPDTDPESA